MNLYSCKPVDPSTYRLTKLDEDLNPIVSYLTTRETCDCPAGVQPTCRHRKMIPRFIARGADRGEWLLDFDAGKWIRAEPEQEQTERSPFDQQSLGDALRTANIPGVTVVDISDPATLYNTIADAVGEPRNEAPTPFTRRV